MDLSKLPKLSDRENPPPAQPPQLPQLPQRVEPIHAMPSAGAEAWLSIAIGVIFLLVFPRFLEWASSGVLGTHFDEFMLNGNVVPYQHVPEFWADLGSTSFGLMLILDGIALAIGKRSLLMISFLFTIAVVAFNLIYLILSYQTYGLAIVSAVAVVLGVYIAMHQWKLLRLTRASA
ncbi:MAG TPA: hypothetical protein VGF52_05560 [Tepidisphaeraceae bacterium]